MFKKAKKDRARTPQVAVLTAVDPIRVAGGDPPATKIKETLTGG